MVRALQLSSELVAEVVSVDSHGPAYMANINPGDHILSVNGKTVSSVDDIHRHLSGWPLDKIINIKVLRQSRKLELHLQPREVKH